MKTRIDVRNKQEGRQIRCALDDPQVRAFVLVMGALIPLGSDRARERVLRFVADRAEEECQIQD